MDIEIAGGTLSLIVGDITQEETEAIVNAANEGLRGGGGVDGAIHRAGGPAIMAACRQIGYCPTGQAVITTGGNLKARFVIHTVGPIYRGGTAGEDKLLKSAYLESLKLASSRGIKSVAFPSISTGAYGFPLNEAAHLALKTIVDYLKEHDDIKTIRFVLFDQRTHNVFLQELKKLV